MKWGDKLDHQNFKNFVLKNAIQKMKRQVMNLQKISDKELVSEYIQNSYDSIKQKTNGKNG